MTESDEEGAGDDDRRGTGSGSLSRFEARPWNWQGDAQLLEELEYSH